MGLLGLTLAVVGVYSVVSYASSQRTHEIGIRMALGAGRARIERMILRQGFLLIAVGIAIGLGVALAVSRVVVGVFRGVSATDPLTFVSVTVLLLAAALAGCLLPARRATRVDPMIALRYE
jgi:putative ABC transport system permease protein